MSIMFGSNRIFCFSQNQTTCSVACLITAWLVIEGLPFKTFLMQNIVLRKPRKISLSITSNTTRHFCTIFLYEILYKNGTKIPCHVTSYRERNFPWFSQNYIFCIRQVLNGSPSYVLAMLTRGPDDSLISLR